MGWQNPDVPVCCSPGPAHEDEEHLEGISVPSSQAGQHVTVAQASAPSWRYHMRDVALWGCHRLAKNAPWKGESGPGHCKTPGAGDSLQGFPRPGQRSPTLPWPRPSARCDTGRAVPPGHLFLLPPSVWVASANTPCPSPPLTGHVFFGFIFFFDLKFRCGLCKRFLGSTGGCVRLRVGEVQSLKNGIFLARAPFLFIYLFLSQHLAAPWGASRCALRAARWVPNLGGQAAPP